jgi:hypothetical protein
MMPILFVSIVLLVIPLLSAFAGEDSRFTHNPLS